MAWTFQYFTSTISRTDLWNKIHNTLNSLDKYVAQTALVSVFDTQIMTDARGGVIFDNGAAADRPDPGILGTAWQYKKFTAPHGQDTGVFQSVIDFLNNPENGLTATQMSWCIVSADVDAISVVPNRQHYIYLWYRV